MGEGILPALLDHFAKLGVMLEDIVIEIVLSKMVKDRRGLSVLGNNDILPLSFLEALRQIVLMVLDARLLMVRDNGLARIIHDGSWRNRAVAM